MSHDLTDMLRDEASRMSALDLYEDLLLTDDKQGKCQTMQEINLEKQQLQEQNSLLQHQLTQAASNLSSMTEQNRVLKENFSSLLETAKLELERKNKVISRLSGVSGTLVATEKRTKVRAKPPTTSTSLKGRRFDDDVVPSERSDINKKVADKDDDQQSPNSAPHQVADNISKHSSLPSDREHTCHTIQRKHPLHYNETNKDKASVEKTPHVSSRSSKESSQLDQRHRRPHDKHNSRHVIRSRDTRGNDRDWVERQRSRYHRDEDHRRSPRSRRSHDKRYDRPHRLSDRAALSKDDPPNHRRVARSDQRETANKLKSNGRLPAPQTDERRRPKPPSKRRPSPISFSGDDNLHGWSTCKTAGYDGGRPDTRVDRPSRTDAKSSFNRSTIETSQDLMKVSTPSSSGKSVTLHDKTTNKVHKFLSSSELAPKIRSVSEADELLEKISSAALKNSPPKPPAPKSHPNHASSSPLIPKNASKRLTPPRNKQPPLSGELKIPPQIDAVPPVKCTTFSANSVSKEASDGLSRSDFPGFDVYDLLDYDEDSMQTSVHHMGVRTFPSEGGEQESSRTSHLVKHDEKVKTKEKTDRKADTESSSRLASIDQSSDVKLPETLSSSAVGSKTSNPVQSCSKVNRASQVRSHVSDLPPVVGSDAKHQQNDKKSQARLADEFEKAPHRIPNGIVKSVRGKAPSQTMKTRQTTAHDAMDVETDAAKTSREPPTRSAKASPSKTRNQQNKLTLESSTLRRSPRQQDSIRETEALAQEDMEVKSPRKVKQRLRVISDTDSEEEDMNERLPGHSKLSIQMQSPSSKSSLLKLPRDFSPRRRSKRLLNSKKPSLSCLKKQKISVKTSSKHDETTSSITSSSQLRDADEAPSNLNTTTHIPPATSSSHLTCGMTCKLQPPPDELSASCPISSSSSGSSEQLPCEASAPSGSSASGSSVSPEPTSQSATQASVPREALTLPSISPRRHAGPPVTLQPAPDGPSHGNKSDRMEGRDGNQQSFMTYYRVAALQMLLHLAKEELASRRSEDVADPAPSRRVWLNSLAESQIRRRRNSRWLSERSEESSPNSPQEHSSQSWKFNEESLNRFIHVTSLTNVISPLKSVRKCSSLPSRDSANEGAGDVGKTCRKILQSPFK